MRKTEPDRKSHSFAFRIEEEVYQRLAISARKHHVALTQCMRWALYNWLDDDEESRQTSRHTVYSPARQEQGNHTDAQKA